MSSQTALEQSGIATWRDFMRTIDPPAQKKIVCKQLNFANGTPGLAVYITEFGGDGDCRVGIMRNKDNSIGAIIFSTPYADPDLEEIETEVGIVTIKSGILIADPGYFIPDQVPDSKKRPHDISTTGFEEVGIRNMTDFDTLVGYRPTAQIRYKRGHNGLGAYIGGISGDCPVRIIRDVHGLVAMVRIILPDYNPDEDNDGVILKEVGIVGVDTASVLIIDPSYAFPSRATKKVARRRRADKNVPLPMPAEDTPVSNSSPAADL